MSKESFSKTISETMYKKTKAIEYLDLKTLLEKDDNFEVALCIAYLSLSKEKIIEKDIKNNDRLSRLTKKVDTIEIDKVFKPGFAKEMPSIIFARENDNLWILDNIRDSIMHGACDIDEERKCFIINNTQYNRELSAEIPFSWFIAYAKNDILSKKKANHYTIKSFYYNKNKKNKKYLETRKELFNNILYRVNIYGNNFNIKEIENRIHELFTIYSEEEISDELLEKYKTKINNQKIKYNEKYLVSFYIAKQKVIEEIQKEFPNITIKIFIDDRKHKLVNKLEKRMPQYFTDYAFMINTFNNGLSPKGISLLRYMTNIIENIDEFKNIEELKEDSIHWKKSTEILHKILTGESIKNIKNNNITAILNQDLKILRSIYLNTYGLSTLVINHENLYNPHFLNKDPLEFGIRAKLKRPFLEFITKQKSLTMNRLELEITLFNKQEQFNKCSNEEAKKKIQATIDDITKKIEQIKRDSSNLADAIGFDIVENLDKIDYQKRQKLLYLIDTYFYHFDKANNVDAKKKIRKVIGQLIDAKIEEDSKYTYGHCSNMQDVLTIIRNSFSHIGRIYVGKNNGIETNIVLNDYDTNGEKSGEVICQYIDLIELLRNPYLVEEKKTHSIK